MALSKISPHINNQLLKIAIQANKSKLHRRLLLIKIAANKKTQIEQLHTRLYFWFWFFILILFVSGSLKISFLKFSNRAFQRIFSFLTISVLLKASFFSDLQNNYAHKNNTVNQKYFKKIYSTLIVLPFYPCSQIKIFGLLKFIVLVNDIFLYSQNFYKTITI